MSPNHMFSPIPFIDAVFRLELQWLCFDGGFALQTTLLGATPLSNSTLAVLRALLFRELCCLECAKQTPH